MKKLLFTFAFLLLILLNLKAQFEVDNEVLKLLDYEEFSKVKTYLNEKITKNPADGQAIYWLCLSLYEESEGYSISEDIFKNTKEILDNALSKMTDNENSAWVKLGLANIEFYKTKDFNIAKQKYEEIFNATLIKKGRNKGKIEPALALALGRFYNAISRTIGDRHYINEKLQMALTIKPINPFLYEIVAKNFLKLSAENGGEAVNAYREQIKADSKMPQPYYNIAKIYATQEQDVLVNNFTDDCKKVDDKFAPVYYLIFEYYSSKDIDKAKHALDKYFEYAEVSPKIEYVRAEYEYRSKEYQNSLNKCYELEKKYGLEKIPQLPLLMSYNFNFIMDSLNAVKYLEVYLQNTPEEKLSKSVYDFAISLYAKIPGYEFKATDIINKLINEEPNINEKAKLINKAIAVLEKAGIYDSAYHWYQYLVRIHNNTTSEYDLYKLIDFSSKSNLTTDAIFWSKKYIVEHPESPNGFYYYRNFAISLDNDTTTGSALTYLDTLNNFYVTNSQNDTNYRLKIYSNIDYSLRFYNKQSNYYKELFYLDSTSSIEVLDSIVNILEIINQKQDTCLNKLNDLFANTWRQSSITSYCDNVRDALKKSHEFILRKRDQVLKNRK